ncbi:uncharacterized protein JCM10292_000463 [Rhodotorula paludigena]|uniref:uncharacterized protein n=1 Tax=Rhodotorula paludigena TaxID=86838 RepID=UPI0031718486
MRGSITLIAAAAAFACAAPLASDSTPLPNSTIALVKQRLSETGTDTWTSGTHMEALLELDYPELSVFSSAMYPPTSTAPPRAVQSIVASWAAKRPSWTNELAYDNGGAAADPAALGVGWLVAAAFADDATKATYLDQVAKEARYILKSVPRLPDGAISHRPSGEAVSLWADFISMVPPFLAYYGVATQDQSLVSEAVNQIKLYRKHLQASSGAWEHIYGGDVVDGGLWNTGNGWAAHGIVRVLATIKKSQYKDDLADEAEQLASWATEILTVAFSKLKSDGFLPNYYGSSTFSDGSGSALLAAAAYRLAQLNGTQSDYILDMAATIRSAVNNHVDTSTGWLAPVVNPLAFDQQASQSPEGEAFVLLLEAAWRDYSAGTSA